MKRCNNCGAILNDDANWCSQCGAKLNNDLTDNINQIRPPHYPTPTPPQKNTSLTVAIWVVAVLLLVGIILFIVTKFTTSSESPISLSDSTAVEETEDDPWAEIDRQRAEKNIPRETIRVQSQETTEPVAPVATWRPRTLNAKYYDATGEYPVKIKFEESDNGEIKNCTFINSNYGTTVPLRGHATESGYTFTGNSSGQSISISFQETGGGSYQGKARIGEKEFTLSASLY